MPHRKAFPERFKKDFPASVVVFLVALPLCLGIALASGAPAFSGIIAGVVGGIVVGYLSGSNLSVSGPAAGLTVVVADAIVSLGDFNTFLLAVCISGVFQIILGFIRAGVLANFFPSSVIKGMLASIGLILILKQLPHALGYDFDYEGDETGGNPMFRDLYYAITSIHPGALLISGLSLITMLVWDNRVARISPALRLIPGALLAVGCGVLLNLVLGAWVPDLALTTLHLVNLPTDISLANVGERLSFPSLSGFSSGKVYMVAVTIALVASIESLLSIEAADRIDPYKRVTPLNRELIAQGAGNFISGLIGGIPITAVIVRTSANIIAGAVSKLSAILHGGLLFLSVIFFPAFLNYIPLASLAAVLLIVGYKLTKPTLFKEMYAKGIPQFLPFLITVIVVLMTDLLKGIAVGSVVGLFFIALSNFHKAVSVTKDKKNYLIRLRYNVSFLNKSILRETFARIPENSYVIIDGSGAGFIDQDIIETIETFLKAAPGRNIHAELKKTKSCMNDYFREEEHYGKLRETIA